MLLNELKTGYVVEHRDGTKSILMPTENRGLVFVRSDGIVCVKLPHFKTNLNHKVFEEYDIMKVWSYTSRYSHLFITNTDYRKLLWERKEILLLPREIEILKAYQTIGYVHIKKGDLYVQVGDENSFYYTTDEVDGLFNNLKLNEEYEIEDLLK